MIDKRATRLFLFSLLAVLWIPAAAEEEDGLAKEWKLISDRNGIQVYSRHTDNSRLKTFKGVTEVSYDDEYTAIALFNDYDAYPKWLHLIDGAAEINREGALDRNLRLTTHLPWPVADREAVVRSNVVMKTTPEEETLTVYIENRPDLIPENSDYVRFPEIQGFLRAKRLPDNRAEVTYQVVLDPGGYVPAWLVNILMRDAPYFTLEKVRRIIKRPEYIGHYYDYIDLRGPGRPEGLEPVKSYLYGNPPDEPSEGSLLPQSRSPE